MSVPLLLFCCFVVGGVVAVVVDVTVVVVAVVIAGVGAIAFFLVLVVPIDLNPLVCFLDTHPNHLIFGLVLWFLDGGFLFVVPGVVWVVDFVETGENNL